VKQCFFSLLLCAVLLAAGCASQPARMGGFGGSSGPEILLPDGEVEEATLLAMGMARSKGWQILEADDHYLLLERQLPEDSPQARMLSPEGVLSPPKLQVETRLRARGNDVVVGLTSYLIINPNTDQEGRVNYSNDYQDQLMISLNALASAWLENRARIASEIPLPPDPDKINLAEANPATPSNPSPSNEPAAGILDPASAATPVEASDDIATTATLATPASIPAVAAAPSIARPPAAGTSAAIPAPLDTGPTPEPAFSSTNDPSTRNEMLVLDSQARRGLWTFYAEASARERGCAVGTRGAVLLSATADFELYEVQCGNSPNLLLRCQGGVCREIN